MNASSSSWQPQAPSVVDWLLTALVAVVTLVFVLFSIYMLRVKRTPYGQPLNFCNVPLLVCEAAAGIVHMFSVLVANSHLQALDFDCAFWTLWMQFVLGLGLWLCFVSARTLTYAFLLSHSLRQPTPRRRHVLTTLACLCILVPPVVVSILGSTLPGTIVRLTGGGEAEGLSAGWCTLTLWARLTIVLWLFTCFGFNLAIALTVRKRHKFLTAHVRQIFRPVRDALLIGLAVTLGEMALVFSEALRQSWGRDVFECLIILLHVATLARLAAVPAWQCWRRNDAYVREFNRMLCPPHKRLVTFEDLQFDETSLDTFMWWCVTETRRAKALSWQHYDDARQVSTTLHAENAYWCWRAIVKRRQLTLSTEASAEAQAIIAFHVVATCTRPVSVPLWIGAPVMSSPWLWNLGLFDELERWLLECFRVRYWQRFLVEAEFSIYEALVDAQVALSSAQLLDVCALSSTENVFLTKKRHSRVTIVHDPSGDPNFTRITSLDNPHEMNAAAHFDDMLANDGRLPNNGSNLMMISEDWGVLKTSSDTAAAAAVVDDDDDSSSSSSSVELSEQELSDMSDSTAVATRQVDHPAQRAQFVAFST